MRRSFCFSRSCRPYSDSRCLRSLFTPPGRHLELALRLERLDAALQEQIGALATRRACTSDRCTLPWNYPSIEPLDAALLGRTAAVMGNRRHVLDVGDLQTAAVQRAHRRLAAGAGAHRRALRRSSRRAPAPRCRPSRPRPARRTACDLREPRKPQPPEVAQDSVLPCRSVIVMIVLLKEACTCAIASSTFLRTFLRAGLPPAGIALLRVLLLICHAVPALCDSVRSSRWVRMRRTAYALPGGAFIFTACLRGPLRVRALVRVRWPRIGRPLR